MDGTSSTLARVPLEAFYDERFSHVSSSQEGVAIFSFKGVPITSVYCQGVVVAVGQAGVFVLDDGTGVVKCRLKASAVGDGSFWCRGATMRLKPGDLCAVKGAPTVLEAVGMELRDCDIDVLTDPNMETLWLLEHLTSPEKP